MGIAVGIATHALRAIEREAARVPTREVCGLLLGTGFAIEVVMPARNVASEPATRFEIDPAILIAAHRAARAGGPAPIGCYHSHPTGDPVPSACDAAMADPDLPIWIIVGRQGSACWIVEENGPVAGRFAPLAVRAAPSGCTTVLASPEGGVDHASHRKIP